MAEKIKELCHTYSPHFLSLLILSTSCLYFSRMLTNSPSSRLAYLADLEIYHEASQSEIHNAYKRLRLVHQLRRDKEQISQVQYEERMARIEQAYDTLLDKWSRRLHSGWFKKESTLADDQLKSYKASRPVTRFEKEMNNNVDFCAKLMAVVTAITLISGAAGWTWLLNVCGIINWLVVVVVMYTAMGRHNRMNFYSFTVYM